MKNVRSKKDHRKNLETKTTTKARCQYCDLKTLKRVVVEREPLQEITEELPERYRKEGYKEFRCNNAIRIKGRNGKWFEATCENHMIGKLKIHRGGLFNG